MIVFRAESSIEFAEANERERTRLTGFIADVWSRGWVSSRRESRDNARASSISISLPRYATLTDILPSDWSPDDGSALRRTAGVGKFEGYFLFMWRVWERGKIHSADSTGRIEPYELPPTVLPAKIVNFRILSEPGLRSPFWSGSTGHREAIRLKRENWTSLIPADPLMSPRFLFLLTVIFWEMQYLRGSLIIQWLSGTLMCTSGLIGKFWATAAILRDCSAILFAEIEPLDERALNHEEWKTSVLFRDAIPVSLFARWNGALEKKLSC